MADAHSVSRWAGPRPRRPTAPPAGAPAQPDRVVARWIARTLAADPPRARSLVVTVWGDALAPHGGAIWLAALIRLLAPFGVNERLVRTSVFRLAGDGWLEAQPQGRRSRYRLTPGGRERFATAYRRIYAPPLEAWTGAWQLVVALPGARPVPLRDELRWAGFASLAPGCFLRPDTGEPMPSIVARAGCALLQAHETPASDGASVAPAPGTSGVSVLAAHTEALWDLAGVAAGYRRFLALFGAVIERFRMRDIALADPAQCFIVRTLLIHAFRRVLLRDPRLPPALLPLDWPGAAAYALTRDFYRLTLARAEAHLAAVFATDGEPLPAAEPSFHDRFGGLGAGNAGAHR
jgi:phenylacetic acid degradation operon negative regulatory protein